jgi:acetyl esterase
MTVNLSTPVLEPRTQAFVDSLSAAGDPPLYTLTPDAARAVLAGAQAVPVEKLDAKIEDTTFPVGPTGSVNIRIVRPPQARGPLPVVFHIHGGGWILGDKNTHDRLTRELAVGANAAVVFVDYDRSPEAHYPTATSKLTHLYCTSSRTPKHSALMQAGWRFSATASAATCPQRSC